MARLACRIVLGLSLLVALAAWASSPQTPSVADRYQLRQRTSQFFERGSVPASPYQKSAPASEPICLCKVVKPQTTGTWKSLALRCPVHGDHVESLGRDRNTNRTL